MTRRNTLNKIKALVLAHHVNVAKVDYDAWATAWDAEAPRLESADRDSFERGVRELLAGLRSSHTSFYHDQPTAFPPQHTIGATFRKVATGWMFLDVFEGGAAHTAGICPGDILEWPDDEPRFGIGQTHRLTVRGGGAPRTVEVTVPARKGTKERPSMVEPRSVSVRFIRPGIGFLKVLHFSGSLGLQFMRELDQAMSVLKSERCDRLIIDLRGNIGGSLGFARLASYLVPGRVEIGYSVTPKALRTGYDVSSLPRVPMPSTRLGLAAALGRFAFRDKSLMLLTQNLGRQPFHGRTVMIVNEWTASAGEMIAAFAKDNRAAVLVGEKTLGTVLGGRNFDVGGGYWLRLSVFGWYTPQGHSIEGVGVTPNIPLPIDEQALTTGLDNQFAKAVELADSF